MANIFKQLKGKTRNIPSIASTANQSADQHKVVAKLFALGSAATWLVIGYDPADELIFGYADLSGLGADGGAEWGYASVEELAALRFMGIPRVELDIHFKPRLFKDCVDSAGRIKV